VRKTGIYPLVGVFPGGDLASHPRRLAAKVPDAASAQVDEVDPGLENRVKSDSTSVASLGHDITPMIVAVADIVAVELVILAQLLSAFFAIRVILGKILVPLSAIPGVFGQGNEERL
jgi:hypothetical protein